ncbi:hypothetical protein PRIPAC_84225, partial [Pristionchus pacificus]
FRRMKRKADDAKDDVSDVEVREEEEDDDNDFILHLRPKGALALKVLFNQTKWNAELTLDKPSRNVVGVAPLKLTISPLLQIAMDERRSSLHLILERENESGTTELMNAHVDVPDARRERVFSLNPYLGVLPLHENKPFSGAVLKNQSITPATKRRKGEHESYLLRMIIEDGETAVVSTVPADSLFPIESGQLMMEQTSVSVSKEYLGLQSDFFAQIFYGGYREGTQEIVELQEVNAEEGHLLINNLYARRPNLSFEDTRVLLTLADRFSLVVLMRKCIEDLMKQDANLSGGREARAQFLLMADRAKSMHALQKILATFKSAAELHDAVMAIAPQLTHATMIKCFEYSSTIAVDLERKLIVERRPRIFFKFGSKRCVVQLLDDVVPVIAKRFYEICHREYKPNNEVVAFSTFHKLDVGGKAYSAFKAEAAWTDGLTEQHVPDTSGLYLAARIDPAYREQCVYVVKHNTRFTNPVTFFGRFVEGKHVTDKQPAGARFHFGIY